MYQPAFRLLAPADSGGGGLPDVAAPTDAVSPPQSSSPEPAVAATPKAPEPTMLDAMFPKAETAEQTAERLRDEAGRFVAKPADKPAEQAAKPEVKPEVKPEDPNKMPDGLKPESQQRFQQLVTTNKELSTKVEQYESQIGYIRETFQANGIDQRQFEQAAKFLGAINKGDFDSALQIIEAQRAQLALAMGKPLPGVDPLADFPDLRQEVDQAQMSEARALEIARYRLGQSAQVQADQQRRQQEQSQQQQQQEYQAGLQGVEAFCKEMQASDIDYAAIEEKLLPRIKSITEGVPPKYWAAKVKETYQIIKEASAPRANPSTFQPLRPTGGASVKASPTSMHEAMWGKTA